MRYRFLAINVPELRSAEAYYRALFDLGVMFREARVSEADDWLQLRPGQGWADAEAAGMATGMVALGRDDVVLALFQGRPRGGRLFAVGLLLADEEIAVVRSRLGDSDVLSSQPGWLEFVDRYGLRWQLAASPEFVGSGTSAGRWLDLG